MIAIEPSQVLVVSKNELINQTINTAFMKETDFKLLDSSLASEGILNAIHELSPDIVLLDFEYVPSEQIFDLVDEIAMQYPKTAVVAILSEETLRFSQQVIMAGARAFMLHPFSQLQLLTALRRVRELQLRSAGATTFPESLVSAKTSNKNFVVFSPKGGVGCTTVATNLAIALYQVIGEEVLLVDGKHLFGDIAVVMNLRTANSISDLIPHAGSMDESLIRQVVARHVSGIQILPSPSSIAMAQGIRPDDLYNVVLGLQSVYPNIVVDGGNYLSEAAVTYMDAASRILLVLTPEMSALRAARQFLDISRSLSYPREKILLVVNKVGRKSDVSVADIEKVLRTKVFVSIPVDEEVAQNSINEGVPVILKKPGHNISKTFKKFAKDLLELVPAPNLVKTPIEPISEVLSKSSRLG